MKSIFYGSDTIITAVGSRTMASAVADRLAQPAALRRQRSQVRILSGAPIKSMACADFGQSAAVRTHHRLTKKIRALADIRRSPARNFHCSEGPADLQPAWPIIRPSRRFNSGQRLCQSRTDVFIEGGGNDQLLVYPTARKLFRRRMPISGRPPEHAAAGRIGRLRV
jgi:hypothetical protein